jgi:Holliday junction resolvasome RuvABC endonuclease subunit
MEPETHIVLALYANSRGLGYACMEIPTSKLIEGGVLNVTPLSNEKILRRVHWYIDFFKPQVVIIRDATTSVSRIQELSDTIATLATAKNMPVHRYTRRQVKDVFEIHGATTKIEIAQRIIKAIPALESRAPKIRKWYMPEDYNMGVFDAVALIMTHEYLVA